MTESQKRFPDVWQAADWSDAVARDISDDDNVERMGTVQRCRTPISEGYRPAGYSDVDDEDWQNI